MRLGPFSVGRFLLISLLGIIFSGNSSSQTPQVKIGSLDLTIGGIQATVTPAKPVIPKNIASGVEVVVTRNGQQLSAAQISQYLGGPFQIVGEYSGPGLTQTVEVPPSPPSANSLIVNLPAVTTAGNYTLSNLRFVVSGATVLDVSPSIIPVQVIDQVLVTSVQTTPLTLDQIQQMGVVLDASSYTGFQFTIGLQLSSQVVNFSFPVVFDNQGVPIPSALQPPSSLPTGIGVPTPTIVPVLLQTADGSAGPTVTLADGSTAPVRIPSVIVIPGDVGYLKQFFSAQLYVSNGAPGGSNLTVDSITGTISLPQAADGVAADAPLSLPNLTSGSQPLTQNVLKPDQSGTPSIASLNPSDTGQAEWTIRGDKEGYYTLNFGINATLEGLPTGPVALTGSAIGAVLVRNPFFDMTFTVPSVVRKGELFNVFATVTNISQVAANNLTVNFDQMAVSGVTPVNPSSPVIPTLNPGDSTTLTFQFTSLQTGKVVANYLRFDTTDGTTGGLHFTLGVYANGTPMSPDTLVLPSSVDNLPQDVVDAAMRVLGQAWSVATAPALPSGVIRTSKTEVTQKALALAEAGLRVSLHEPLSNSLRDLAADFFGPPPIDPGFDQVLRTTPAGQNFVSVLGANLAQPAVQAGGAVAYESQLAQIEASGPDFITFGVGSGTGSAPVSITLTDAAGHQITSATRGGSIVGGMLLPLGNSASVPYLGLLQSPSLSPYTMVLQGQASGSVDLSISIPRGDGTVVRGVVTGVSVTQGLQMRLVADLTNPNSLVLQVDTAGNGTYSTNIPLATQAISPAGPTLISATVIDDQVVSQAGYFGMNFAALFDRIVDGTTGGTPSNYSVRNNTVTSASKQLSGRLVFGNLLVPEGPYVATAFSVNGVADQRGAVGLAATVNLQSLLHDPGAVVSGRILNPDGTPNGTATVTYINIKSDPPQCTLEGSNQVGLAKLPAQPNGTYQLRYVHQDQCGGPFQVATKDPKTGALREASARVQTAGQQIVIDLGLLGVGSVSGKVTDLSGNPVYNAKVAAISGTDPQVGGSSYTDGNGNYTINGITVGPVTVEAALGTNGGISAGNIERAGTTAVVNVTLNGGSVNVSGVVTQSLGGVVSPVAGTPVGYYLTAPTTSLSTTNAVGYATTKVDGSYSITGMPAGPYKVTAFVGYLSSIFTASQTGTAAAGENIPASLQVVIPATGTVNGKVVFPNGTPAGGAIVSLGGNGVLSNSDGTFSLTGVPVLPSTSQTISATTTDRLRTGQTTVIVNSATTPVTANITLSGIGSAQLTVLDAAGNPVVGQRVAIPDFITAPPTCGTIAQTTDANGVAVFNGLGLGAVSFAAVRTQGGAQDLASATVAIPKDGVTGFATMRFGGFGTVTGSVVDPQNRPVLGAAIQLTSNTVNAQACVMDQEGTQSVQTDVNGKFQFNQVNIGKVGVTAAQAFYPTPVGAQSTLTQSGSTVNFPLQMVSSTSGVLSGTIFMPDGVTPAGAGVQVTANGPLPNVSVFTDSSGNYKFAKIFPQGGYTLTANDPVSGGTNQINIYLRASQDTTQNLRLKGTGTINVTVVDGAGATVSTAFVTLTETDFPNASFSGSLDASNQGVLAFANVFEGKFSVQVTDPFGRGGRASGTLPQGTSSVNIQVQLTTTGTVQGHFYMPDGTTPIPNASVQLTESGQVVGQFTTLGTGDVGSFVFQYVPAGPVELKALDPLTGRTGIAAGALATQGQVLPLDIKAQGLDTVEGVVTSNGSPQPGAVVNIVSGTFQATTQADASGAYMMGGVPEGVIVATASLGNGFLSGTASAPISGDGNALTLNVALRSSGRVSGQVVMADGATAAPTSTVSISVGGTGGGTQTTTTDAQGNFTLQEVPAGTGTITAQVLGGIDEATMSVNVAGGATTTVQVKLNGTGAISGVALDSSGNPTPGTVVLQGTGTFPYYLNLTAAADGTFFVPQVLAGPFTAQLSVNSSGVALYGTTTGTVNSNQTTKFTVQVQPSGTIRGLVVRSDGQTPAVGANVTIRLAGMAGLPFGALLTLQVQNDGTFTATGVPLDSFSVQITDPLTNGLAAVEGQSLSSNGQTANLGTIVLDANALSVVATNPANGATGVGVNQAVTATFSEALPSTSGINVTTGATPVLLGTSLSSDGKTVTLQGQMPDGQQLTLNITNQVTDVFGRQLLQPQTIQFTTVDLTPPSVISIAPSYGAIQVPTSASVAVTFNKTLSTTVSLANVITVSSGGNNIPGTISLTAPNVLTFTPASSLVNNAIYNVTENGAASFGGNVQTIAYTSYFVSPETIPPVLQLSSPLNGSFINNSKPTISINLSDVLTGINAASGALILDGQPVTPLVGSSLMSFTPPAALADGTHTLTASVQNKAGILGMLSASFTIDTAPPSVATLTGITGGQVVKGSVPISASATDAVSGIAQINFLVDGVTRATLTGPNFSATFNTAVLPDGPHTFSVQATNNAGTTGPASSAIQAFIENVPLSVSITSPANGTPFKGTVTVTALPSEPVQKITFSLGTQTVTATASPYLGTLSLAGVADGPQIVTVTAYDFVGDAATNTVTVTVMQTPPAAPNANLIFAEPPNNNGISLVHGLSSAVGSSLLVTIADAVSHATASTTAAADGSFATNLIAAVNDTLSLTATDVVGNVSAATLISVRSTPSLPPSSGNTSLVYQGNLVDRVSLTAGNLTPDGLPDAVFTLSLSIGNNITRTLSYITLQGGGLTRSTQAGSVPLGVAPDVGSPLLNSPSGPVSFPITTGATLTLFAGDGGFIQPGTTYTATAVFTDGSQFVGSFTIVAPADRQYVAHSATITASPTTVVVNGTTPGTTTLTISNIQDINGTAVPDGAMIALSATNMASLDPTGNAIVSAGGAITDGTPAANNANFKVYTIQNGTVTATYSSQPITPASVTGALAVIQMQAADAAGNVLGTTAVSTLDLNIRASTDQAIVGVAPSSLYGDKGDHRSHFTIQVTNGAGTPVPDGTPVVVSVWSCASRLANSSCINSAQGQILGGQPAASGSIYSLFTVQGGTVQGDYSSSGISSQFGQVQGAIIQVLSSDSHGSILSSTALGTGQVTIAGGGSSEVSVTPQSVPYVFPPVPAQVFIHHLHDVRANLVPDGANVVVSATNCAGRALNFSCISSAGGTITDGLPSPSGSIYKYYTLTNHQASATYASQGVTAPPATGQSATATMQVLMADGQGILLDSHAVGTAPLALLGPANAIGFSQPAIIFADGGLHTATVTFRPILDAYGNPIPDGSAVLASATNCAGRFSNFNCIASTNGQVLNGAASPSGSNFKLFTVQNGAVTVTYGDQGISSSPGQIQTGNVVLLPSDASGNQLSSIALGMVPVGNAGLTSATGVSSPVSTFADGGDHRTTITINNFKDAAGQPVPDGTVIAASASNCFARLANFNCINSAGGQVIGSNAAPFNSSAQLYTVTNGQVVFPYSSLPVSVATGSQTATVQLQTVTPQGGSISSIGITSVPVQLLSPGSGVVSPAPIDLFSDGGDHRSQLVLNNLVDSDGTTPMPNGAIAGLTAANCAARFPNFNCVTSVGGTILSAGTTPGDGSNSPSNSSFQIFTVAGGQVQAVYSDQNIASGVNQTQTVSVAAAPATNTGNILSTTSYAVGTINLRGMTSATASGPSSVSISGGGTVTITFTGIKDSAGNTVPDGTNVGISAVNCASRFTNFNCVSSVGGTIVGGTVSPNNGNFKIFPVSGGSVSITYSPAGASTGTAGVQIVPAMPNGSIIGSTSLIGGVWSFTVTN